MPEGHRSGYSCRFADIAEPVLTRLNATRLSSVDFGAVAQYGVAGNQGWHRRGSPGTHHKDEVMSLRWAIRQSTVSYGFETESLVTAHGRRSHIDVIVQSFDSAIDLFETITRGDSYPSTLRGQSTFTRRVMFSNSSLFGPIRQTSGA